MQNLVNRVQLIGHLGADAELKTFDNGNKMLRVSIATDASYKDKDGKKVEETQWHNLVAWGGTAELGEKFLKKGRHVAVEGTLVNRSYDDKEGNKQYITEVKLNEFLLLGKKED